MEAVDGRHTSVVWRHFERLGDSKFKCRECGKILCASRGSTSPLIRHYRHIHTKTPLANSPIKKKPKVHANAKEIKALAEENFEDSSRKHSAIWKHFIGCGQERFVCRHCRIIIRAKNGSTTSLHRHYRSAHGSNDMPANDEPKDGSLHGGTSWNDDSKDDDYIGDGMWRDYSKDGGIGNIELSDSSDSDPFDVMNSPKTDLMPAPIMDHRAAKIGFFGGGNIARAIGGGLIKSGAVTPSNIMISAPSTKSFPKWMEWGAKTTHDNNELIESCDMIFLCMKPYQFEDAIASVNVQPSSSKLFVSTLSGTSLSKLYRVIREHVENFRLIRSMPNTPLLVGTGCTVIAPDTSATQEDVNTVISVFRTLGKCEVVPERLISPVIGVAGSSPAFIYMVIEAMADAGVKNGLPRDKAQTFAAQAVMGAAKMVLESGYHPGQLKDQVCSPGGTTIYGVQALEKAGLRSAIIEAVDAATNRSEEMTALYD